MNNDLYQAAYHESGHALIYYLLGHEIKSISIDEYGNGFCESNSYKPSRLDFHNLVAEISHLL